MTPKFVFVLGTILSICSTAVIIWSLESSRNANDVRPSTHLSIIVACMNRAAVLNQSIPTWLALDPLEILIVDWSSIVPLANQLFISDSRIKILRVEQQDQWILTQAYNLALFHAKGKYVLKVDVDTMIERGFFEHHPLPPMIFYTGNWKQAREENERHLNGVVYAHRKDLIHVNGYDERIVSYGWDDDDLYYRLEQIGLVRVTFKVDYLKHLMHDNSERLSKTSKTFVDVEILRNQALTNISHWGTHHQRSRWQSQQAFKQTVYLRQQAPVSFEASVSQEQYDNITLAVYRRVLLYSSGLPSSFINQISSIDRLESLLRIHTLDRSSKWIVIHVQHGLCNRLRAIASAIAFANATNRLLRVIWPIDSHIGASYAELFQSPRLDVVAEFDPLELNSRFDIYSYMETDVNGFKDQYINNSEKHIYVKTAYTLNNTAVNESAVMLIFQNFVPIRKVVDEINFFKEQELSALGPRDLVGVHVRNLAPDVDVIDITHDMYSEDAWYRLRKFRQLCSAEAFEKHIQMALTDCPHCHFFVAADNVSIAMRLQAKFGSRIHFRSNSCSARTVKCVQDALVDLYILREASTIIGSFWSSFSDVAAMLHPGHKASLLYACGSKCPIDRIHLILQIPPLLPGGAKLQWPTSAQFNSTAISFSRSEEYLFALSKNFNHHHVESIHLLYEDEATLLLIKNLGIDDPCLKLQHSLLGTQMTYKDAFHYASQHIANGSLYMILNADTYLGGGFEHVSRHTLQQDEVLALSRHEDPLKPCVPINLCKNYRNSKGGFLSHDGFLLRRAISDAEQLSKLDFVQNLAGAENVLIHELKSFGFRISNPCLGVKIFHVHCTRPETNNSRESWRRSEDRFDVQRCKVKHCGDGWVEQGSTHYEDRYDMFLAPVRHKSSVSRGILYVALSNSDYVKQACLSAWSIYNSSAITFNITLVTDITGKEIARECMKTVKLPLFSQIIDLQSNPPPDFKSSWKARSAKIRGLRLTPYDMTIYLDTDTIVCGWLHELFDVLDFAEFAAAHNPGSAPARENNVNLPVAFHPLNSGVIVYRKTESVRTFLKAWESNYFKVDNPTQDQASFRQTLWSFRHDLRLYVLHRTWNCRYHETWNCPATIERKSYITEEQCRIYHNQYLQQRYALPAARISTTQVAVKGGEKRKATEELKARPEAGRKVEKANRRTEASA